MSVTPTTKQKEDGIPTCNEYAPYRMALFGTCGYVPVACVRDVYSNLHKNKFRDFGIQEYRIEGDPWMSDISYYHPVP
jgi:hypothetical protein